MIKDMINGLIKGNGVHITQGDIYWVSLSPTIGTEIHKTRPGVVVSSDVQNISSARVMIVPVTSQITKIYPFDAAVCVDGNPAKAMANQMRSVDKKRLGKYIGTITKMELRNIQSAIRIVLELE